MSQTRIKPRQDTAANWTSNNPVMASGEHGYETDNLLPGGTREEAIKFKIGDGVTHWNDLPYEGTGTTLLETLADISVRFATTGNLTATYANGTAGVGRTLTATSNGAFPTTDGIAPALNNQVLVWKQTTKTQNGVYVITDLGSAGTPYILTGDTSGDTQAEIDEQVVFVIAGTLYGNKYFTQQTTLPVVGTDNIVFKKGLSKGADTLVIPANEIVYGNAAGDGVTSSPIFLFDEANEIFSLTDPSQSDSCINVDYGNRTMLLYMQGVSATEVAYINLDLTTPGSSILHLSTTEIGANVGQARIIMEAIGTGPSLSSINFLIDGYSNFKMTDNSTQLLAKNTSTNELRFYENTTNGTDYIGFKAPASRTSSTSVIIALPVDDPTSGQVMQFSAPSGGVVTASWVTPGGSTAITATAIAVGTGSGITGYVSDFYYSNATGEFNVSSAASNTYININPSAGIYELGDLDVTGHKLYVSDSGLLQLSAGQGLYVNMSGANRLTTIGDSEFNGQNTYIRVNDDTEIVTFSKRAITIGPVAYTFPSALGAAGTVLTDAAGDGILSWAAPSVSGYLLATGATTGATSQAQVFTNGIKAGVIDDNATSEIIFTVSTVQKAAINATGIGLIDGSAANPSYYFSNDSSTGFYLKGVVTDIGVSVNGALVGGFDTTGLFAGLAGTLTGTLKFNGATSGTVTVQSAAAAGTWTLTLPTTDGDANEFLQTNGSGVTTWAAIAVYTDEEAQDAVGAMIDTTLVYVDATPLLTRAALAGDVTAPQGSNTTTIANDAVTYAKMQNVSATDKLLGRSTAGAGDVEEISCTSFGRSLIDDADAAAARATLGAGYDFTCQTANGVTVGSGLTVYAVPFFGGSFNATETNRQLTVKSAGVAQKLYVRTNSAQSGLGSLVITVRKNAADTAVTLTIAAGAAAGRFTDLSNTVSFAAGDLISYKVVNNAAATSANVMEIGVFVQ
jgi:hypothetical protein